MINPVYAWRRLLDMLRIPNVLEDPEVGPYTLELGQMVWHTQDIYQIAHPNGDITYTMDSKKMAKMLGVSVVYAHRLVNIGKIEVGTR